MLSAAFFLTWATTYLTGCWSAPPHAANASILDELDSLRRFESATQNSEPSLTAIVRLDPGDSGRRFARRAPSASRANGGRTSCGRLRCGARAAQVRRT